VTDHLRYRSVPLMAEQRWGMLDPASL
jgi:hypothetical protein